MARSLRRTINGSIFFLGSPNNPSAKIPRLRAKGEQGAALRDCQSCSQIIIGRKGCPFLIIIIQSLPFAICQFTCRFVVPTSD